MSSVGGSRPRMAVVISDLLVQLYWRVAVAPGEDVGKQRRQIGREEPVVACGGQLLGGPPAFAQQCELLVGGMAGLCSCCCAGLGQAGQVDPLAAVVVLAAEAEAGLSDHTQGPTSSSSMPVSSASSRLHAWAVVSSGWRPPPGNSHQRRLGSAGSWACMSSSRSSGSSSSTRAPRRGPLPVGSPGRNWVGASKGTVTGVSLSFRGEGGPAVWCRRGARRASEQRGGR